MIGPFKLGHFDGGPQFDLIENGLQRRVFGPLALVAHGAAQAV